MKWYALGLMLLTMLLVVACGAPAITPQTPPEIVYGEDVCDHCGMIINDERFAAGVVIQTQPDQYEHRIFDDIGDMFAYAQAANTDDGDEPIQIVSYFVHDYQSQAWLDANQAHFVKADTSSTPMGSGLAAFANQEEADAQALAWQGTVLDFETALHQIALEHSHAQH